VDTDRYDPPKYFQISREIIALIQRGALSPGQPVPSENEIIEKYRVAVPSSVRQRFEEGARGSIPETPKPGDPLFARVDKHIIANNRLMVEAAVAKAKQLRFNTLILGTEVEGEARDVGGIFAAIAREIGVTGNPVRMPACILAAGETTVTVRGDGIGGRNQEMALAWAIAMAARPSALNDFNPASNWFWRPVISSLVAVSKAAASVAASLAGW